MIPSNSTKHQILSYVRHEFTLYQAWYRFIHFASRSSSPITFGSDLLSIPRYQSLQKWLDFVSLQEKLANESLVYARFHYQSIW